MKNKKYLRFYIIGEVRGTHRIQNIIKFVTDDWRNKKLYFENIYYNNYILRFLKSFFINWINILRSDVVYVCTLNVGVNIFWELIIAKLFRKKILVDFYVSVYDTVILDRQMFSETSIFALFAKWCDKLFLKLATKVFFLTEVEQKLYYEIANVKSKPNKNIIVPLCIEDTNFKPNIKDDDGYFNICWWGSYVPLHGLEYIIEAADLTKDKNKKIRWYLFGDKRNSAIYSDLINKYNLENIVFFRDDCTFLNGKLTQFLESNCDLVLGVFGSSEKSKNVLPNKVVEGCMLKQNVLTGESEAVREFFNPSESLFLCDRTAEGISKKVLNIVSLDSKTLSDRREKSYIIYKNNFSINVFINTFSSILDEVSNI